MAFTCGARRRFFAALLAATLALTGCAGAMRQAASSPAPPSPAQADAADPVAIEPSLRPSAYDSPAPVAAAEAERAARVVAETAGHDHNVDYRHVDAGRAADAPGEGHVGHDAHSAAATPQSAAAIYSCPLHPNIQESAPGACPICGTPLEKKAG
jgi:hypothetical protein